jgi:hypothetical protein
VFGTTGITTGMITITTTRRVQPSDHRHDGRGRAHGTISMPGLLTADTTAGLPGVLWPRS